MTTKTVYLFDDKGVYTQPYEAYESPAEPGEFIAPIKSTQDTPPVVGNNQVACRNVENTAWTLIPDFRGQTVFDQATGAVIEIDTAGPLPEGLALTPPPLTPAQQKNAITIAIQMSLDAMAQQRGYDSIVSACAYAAPTAVVPSTDPNFSTCEKFRIEGNALQAWRASTWAACYAYLATVDAGKNSMPTPDEAVEMMSPFIWPD